MTRTRRPSPRRALGALAGLAVAIVGVSAVALWHPWTGQPVAGPAAAGGVAIAAVEPLELPEHPRVLVFGDSWTYGSAARAPELGYAYVLAGLLDGETVVRGVRGSGYLKPGIDGPDFGTRIGELDPSLDPDLVIIQGSINDRRLPADGYRDAVGAAWDAMAERYPDAAIVILGPAPQVLPVEPATARIDRDLSALAGERGWAYISPVAEQWITPEDYGWIIDTGAGNDHPTTEGHAYLAEKLAAALAALRPAPAD